MKVKITDRIFYFVLAAALLVIYGQHVWQGQILNRDDTWLLDPLFSIKSIKEFIYYLFSSKNPDLQPVRDLSLMVDVVIFKFTGLYSFHLQNVLLWSASCLFVRKIFRRFTSNANTWALFFAVHPIVTMNVSWISARKHILAFLFIAWATDAFLAWNKNPKKKYVFEMFGGYFLSLFAQPVAIFWPLWCLFYVRKWRIEFIPFLGLMVFTLWANYCHYAAVYGPSEQLEAIGPFAINSPGDILLALGRYTWNIFFPWKYTVTYARESWENIVGLGLLPLITLYFTRRLGAKKVITWISLAAVTLFLPVTKIYLIFVSDTYALIPLLAVMILALEAVDANLERWPQLAFVLLLAFTAISVRESAQWKSDFRLWQRNYSREPDCRSSLNYAFSSLQVEEIQEFLGAMKFHIARGCLEQVSGSLLPLAVYYDDSLTPETRIRDLKIQRQNKDLSALLAAALLAKTGSKEDSQKILIASYANNPRIFEKLAAVEIWPLKILSEKICADAATPVCESLRAKLAATELLPHRR